MAFTARNIPIFEDTHIRSLTNEAKFLLIPLLPKWQTKLLTHEIATAIPDTATTISSRG
jgi:hypothetical protein